MAGPCPPRRRRRPLASASAGYTEAMAAPPTVLFALTAGLLTALTPCVYPMIPITISIFGAKTGVSRGARAGAGDVLRRRHRVHVRRARDGVRAAGQGVRNLPGQPVGRSCRSRSSSSPMGLSMFGAFELALPSGLQKRLSRVGGKGFGGAFLMGLVGGIIAAPCTGPPLAGILAYVATTRDAVFGFGLLATYARRHRPALLGAGRVLDVAAAIGRVDGVGEERLRHRAVHGRALLPEERRARRWRRSPAARRSSSRARWRWCWSGRRWAPCT